MFLGGFKRLKLGKNGWSEVGLWPCSWAPRREVASGGGQVAGRRSPWRECRGPRPILTPKILVFRAFARGLGGWFRCIVLGN